MPQRRHDGDEVIARFAKQALDAFRADAPDSYKALVKEYEGSAASVGVFGVGSCKVKVSNGVVRINPKSVGRAGLSARGAIYPEALAALAEGKLTALEAFHKRDLVVQTLTSDDLHGGYSNFVKHSDAALRSKRLQKAFKDFREAIGA